MKSLKNVKPWFRKQDGWRYLTPVVVQLSARLVAAHPTGPVFRNSYGDPWTSDAAGFRLKNLRQRLDLPAGTVAYAYRHTFCTRGLESGISPAGGGKRFLGTSARRYWTRRSGRPWGHRSG